MNDMPGIWIQFVLAMVLIGYAGGKLAHHGDILGYKAGWSDNWAGLLLLSTVTSLPELATGISAAGFAGNPDIAAGDVFGSCTFNLLLLVVVDALYRKQPLYCDLKRDHDLSAAFGVVLLALAGAAMALGKRLDEAALWHVGIASPLTLALYVLFVREIGGQERRHGDAGPGAEPEGAGITVRRAILLYLASAAVVVAAGARLPFVAMRLAELMGWQDSFVGTLFVGAATSTPELVVMLAALRAGKPDMAVASLLGSNMFNMVMLGIDDLVYRKGPMLSHVSPVHAVSLFAALAMTGLVIAALQGKPTRRVFGMVSWHSLGLVALFAVSSFAQYRYGQQ